MGIPVLFVFNQRYALKHMYSICGVIAIIVPHWGHPLMNDLRLRCGFTSLFAQETRSVSCNALTNHLPRVLIFWNVVHQIFPEGVSVSHWMTLYYMVTRVNYSLKIFTRFITRLSKRINSIHVNPISKEKEGIILIWERL